MVRRKGGRRKTASKKVVKVHGKAYVCKPTRGSKAKYKKCILTAIRTTKFTTRKGAQKAFRAAAKKCSPLLVGVKARKGRRKGGRKTARKASLPGMPTRWTRPSFKGTAAQLRALERRMHGRA